MSCPNQNFQADFYNNVAAVAIVLIFARVVAHRIPDVKTGRSRAIWHVLAVVAAAVAAGAALLATERCSNFSVLHWLAAGGLVIASIVFVAEIVIDDVLPAWDVKRRLCRSKGETNSVAG